MSDKQGVPEIPVSERVWILSYAARVKELERKLAIIFDNSCYSDSLGVEGSSFTVCRWCGGGSGPGGNPGFSHNAGCLMDDSVLEAKVQQVWEEVPSLEAENERLRKALERSDAVVTAAASFCAVTACEMIELEGTQSAAAPAEFMLLQEAIREFGLCGCCGHDILGHGEPGFGCDHRDSSGAPCGCEAAFAGDLHRAALAPGKEQDETH